MAPDETGIVEQVAATAPAPVQAAPVAATPGGGPEVAPQVGQGAAAPPAGPPPQTPATGRLALRNITRQLTEADLGTPGVQKLLVDLLERSDEENISLRNYMDLFHAKDKEAAILAADLRTNRALEIFFAAGLAFGGIIAGLAGYFWAKKEPDHIAGTIALVVGVGMLVASIFARLVNVASIFAWWVKK
jgi:hypothetical protein